MRRVLVTGATGFVGRVLCSALSQDGYIVRAALREERTLASHDERVIVGDIGPETNWTAALEDVDFVIHAAARAHIVRDSPKNAALYFETNVAGTRALAEASMLAQVRRFIFVSSVKVNGEETTSQPFRSSDPPRSEDAYGESKRLAEMAIAELAERSRMETVVVRPPLVYGSGVRANFLRLMRWIDQGRPLPFGAINNSRSLVSVWNLCALLVNVLHNAAAPGGTWMVSDGNDVSTPELVRRLAACMGRPANLLSIPGGVLRCLGAITGRAAEVRRLCGSLQVDISATRRSLGWEPPVPLHDGLARTVAWYRAAQSARANEAV
jgi:nucleoside-diphosphate-sugar epimerase